MENRRSLWYLDTEMLVGGTHIPVNQQLLSLQSPFFRALLSPHYREQAELPLEGVSAVVVDMVVNFLMVGVLAVPYDYSLEGWA